MIALNKIVSHNVTGVFDKQIRVLRDLAPVIEGSEKVVLGPNDVISLDGSQSFDPESTVLKNSNISFTWSCTTTDLKIETLCNGKEILRNDSRVGIAGKRGEILTLLEKFPHGVSITFNLTMRDVSPVNIRSSRSTF